MILGIFTVISRAVQLHKPCSSTSGLSRRRISWERIHECLVLSIFGAVKEEAVGESTVISRAVRLQKPCSSTSELSCRRKFQERIYESLVLLIFGAVKEEAIGCVYSHLKGCAAAEALLEHKWVELQKEISRMDI